MTNSSFSVTDSFHNRQCSKEALTGKETKLKTYYEQWTRYLYHIGFSVSRGIDRECSMFHKHVAERLAIKTSERYEKIISSIWCKLSFLILKLAVVLYIFIINWKRCANDAPMLGSKFTSRHIMDVVSATSNSQIFSTSVLQRWINMASALQIKLKM